MDIAVNNLQKKIKIPQTKIIRTVQRVVKKLSLPQQELSIVFVGEQKMRTLNNQFLKHDYVTDVLTFNFKESGEIVICPSVAEKNAKTHQMSTEKELILYVIHGILHLAGYDDHSPKDIEKMRLKENEFLNLL